MGFLAISDDCDCLAALAQRMIDGARLRRTWITTTGDIGFRWIEGLQLCSENTVSAAADDWDLGIGTFVMTQESPKFESSLNGARMRAMQHRNRTRGEASSRAASFVLVSTDTRAKAT
ncbi:hypothetical protein CLAFUW4_00125 [Fulvia fulva]|uniref:Uncharacterized protein n=1 Tax=Passalora fulva TaxID=5499 RepID=A0A9Q8P462_PASFU|nr:uncharacterized protein CLAFUR5_00124 [Fulvia fulva]KAK4636043.1 hypothetical protein CLAFUR4_00125 [Fulvia fulva]KAK4638650.1 hypothetical protein CLAFUR0_00123 [Fulvia fulva]UJO12481.1 hypothetical protein CLAFUR5_00124 [Fulvia fulva]WPV09176.1 hypothetical protein CLAFUW4_00125 [Fulvia fulva]WPV25175.1 hypothetical protein CLAFUW7_00125 [Fulvia fulva]